MAKQRRGGLDDLAIDNLVGAGAMGRVWRAYHIRSGRPVALKVITADHRHDARYTEAFRREVQAVAGMHHRGVVRVYDYGVAPEDQLDAVAAGSHWVSMELCRESLADQPRPKNWTTLRTRLSSLLGALAHAHARGLVHRDIKPANILTTFDGRQVLSDFGLVHAFRELADESMVSGRLAGTPAYMAPEQFEGSWRDYGPWTDLYAVGCVVYDQCNREPPFGRTNVYAIANGHMATEPPPLQPSFAIPRGFTEWVQRLLRKGWYQRFPCAADAMAALDSLPDVEGHNTDTAQSRGADGEEPPTMLLGHPGEPTAPSMPDARPDTGPTMPLANEEARQSTVVVRETLSLSRQWPRPRLPAWRDCEHEPRPAPREQGLGLFGLREVPFRGRNNERDLIWDTFARVSHSQSPRAVVLRGEAGCGKSRLSQWACRLLVELGCAHVLKATHSPQPGPGDGIIPMVARWFSCARLSQDRMVQRVRQHLLRLGTQRATAQKIAERLARAMLAHRAEPSQNVELGPTHPMLRASELFSAIVDALELATRDRPVVVWLDDVQWGAPALGLASHILRRHTACLVLITARDEALVGIESRLLAELAEHPHVQSQSLRPLDSETHRALITGALPITPNAVDELFDRTEGNPLFAVQLLTDWVQRGILENGPDGYESALDTPVPANLQQLWITRLDAVLAMVEGATEEHRNILELASALGQQLDMEDLAAVCRFGNLATTRQLEHLVATLVDHGLATRDDDRSWAFAHGLLRESIELVARRANRWRTVNLACARALQEQPEDAERTLRIAEHLHRAGEFEEALWPTLQAAGRHYVRADFPGTERWLSRYEELLANLDGEHLARQALCDWRWAKLEFGRGRQALAEQRARQACKRAHTCGAREIEISASSLLAFLDWLAGDVHIGREKLLQAYCSLPDTAPHEVYCELEQRLSYVESYHDPDRALIYADRLLRRARQSNDVVSEAVGLAARFEGLKQANRLTEAERCSQQMWSLADSFGLLGSEAAAAEQLGEIARLRGQWRVAREHIERAIEQYRHLDHIDLPFAEYQLALVDLYEGHVQRAQETLENILALTQSAGRRVWDGPLLVQLAACRIRSGDLPGATALSEQAEQALARTKLIDLSVSQTLSLALVWLVDKGADSLEQRVRTLLVAGTR